MSRTLFWYLFRDLLRVFVLTTLALAGIMSFGGLLRPLTEQGLDTGQVGKMLTYFVPAMSTYSLPVAALFATTMVYGRLAADNELTACRAAGIGFGTIALPALVLGLTAALSSLFLLCYVVPAATLRVERVIYSNVAKLVANKIGRDHQLRLSVGGPVIYAPSAQVGQEEGGNQTVRLIEPTIVTTDSVPEDPSNPSGPKLKVPHEIYMADEATVWIRLNDAQRPELGMTAAVQVSGGVRFPHDLAGDEQVGVEETTVANINIPPQIRENVKFMDVRDLTDIAVDPGKSQRVKLAVDDFKVRDQGRQYLADLMAQLNGPSGSCAISRTTTGGDDLAVGETYVLSRQGAATIGMEKDAIVIDSGESADARRAQLVRQRNGHVEVRALGHRLRIEAEPQPSNKTMVVTIDVFDVVVTPADAQPTPRAAYNQTVVCDMPPDVSQIANRTLKDYNATNLTDLQWNFLNREQLCVANDVLAELHSRASFAVSCLILVVVGTALGLMFQSGNFLNAFAVSFLPALMTITLIVGGAQAAGHLPDNVLVPHFRDPLHMGIALIWSGNAMVLALAAVLSWKLSRT